MQIVSLPLVTIVTPSYNRARYLPETIDSVLAQHYPNIEYIVLDDGSTDNTREILEKYTGRLTWESHPNMGETRTVNKGWGMAHGEFVMVVNSDDPVLPDLVGTLVEYMQAHPDLLVAYPDWYEIDADSKRLRLVHAWNYCYADMVRYSACLVGPGALIRRKAIELEPGRNPDYRYVGDLEYWLRLGMHGPFARVPQPLATHRRHQDSAGESKGVLIGAELIHLMESLFTRPDLPSEIRALQAEAMGSAYYDTAKRCVEDYQTRWKYLWKSLVTYPRAWILNSSRYRVNCPSFVTFLLLLLPPQVYKLLRYVYIYRFYPKALRKPLKESAYLG